MAGTASADIRGTVDVVDGDTFHINGATVRLHGIDAPEVDQSCQDREGQTWMCGVSVQDDVRALYQGRTATCQEVDRDRYGRSVAKCFVDGQDIGEQIVLNGWAESYRQYSLDYVTAEASAQSRRVGIWAGQFQSPTVYRAEQREKAQSEVAVVTAPGDCEIKGNISTSGRIYHMPHNRDYSRTRINTSNGERWFCSEAEATAAGWRAARN